MKTSFSQLEKENFIFQISRDFETDEIEHSKLKVISVDEENQEITVVNDGDEDYGDITLDFEDDDWSSNVIDIEDDGHHEMLFTSYDDVVEKLNEIRQEVENIINEITEDFK